MPHLVASAITNPGQLIGFPIAIFEAAINFGLSMMKQSSEFVLALFRMMV